MCWFVHVGSGTSVRKVAGQTPLDHTHTTVQSMPSKCHGLWDILRRVPEISLKYFQHLQHFQPRYRKKKLKYLRGGNFHLNCVKQNYQNDSTKSLSWKQRLEAFGKICTSFLIKGPIYSALLLWPSARQRYKDISQVCKHLLFKVGKVLNNYKKIRNKLKCNTKHWHEKQI